MNLEEPGDDYLDCGCGFGEHCMTCRPDLYEDRSTRRDPLEHSPRRFLEQPSRRYFAEYPELPSFESGLALKHIDRPRYHATSYEIVNGTQPGTGWVFALPGKLYNKLSPILSKVPAEVTNVGISSKSFPFNTYMRVFNSVRNILIRPSFTVDDWIKSEVVFTIELEGDEGTKVILSSAELRVFLDVIKEMIQE